MILLVTLEYLQQLPKGSNVPLQCEYCSEHFTRKLSVVKRILNKTHITETARFCSKICRNKANKTSLLTICCFCEFAFERRRVKSDDHSERYFCSRKCYQLYRLQNINKTDPKFVCIRCGCVCSRGKTLCQDCYKLERIEKHSLHSVTLGEYWKSRKTNNQDYHRGRSGISKLARLWNPHLKNQPCENCAYDKHTELAHIKAVAAFENTATLYQINGSHNIAVLCPNCHWEFDKGLLKIEQFR